MIDRLKNAPCISVIVPIYKVDKYLNECLLSITEQTYHRLEIILVNDGSPDRCSEICEHWKKNDTRIKLIHQENRGLSAARNAGLNIANGDYILLIDSDDYVSRDLCQYLIEQIMADDAEILIFGYKRFDDQTKETLETKQMPEQILCASEAVNSLLREDIDNYAWNKLYKRELFSEIRYPEGFFWEDIGTTYRLFLKADKIKTCSKVGYYYRQRNTSITSNVTIKGLQDIYELRLRQFEDLKYVKNVDEMLGFHNLVESAFLLYNKSFSTQFSTEKMNELVSFLNANKQLIRKYPFYKRYRLFYRCRMLYNLQMRVRYLTKRLLKG